MKTIAILSVAIILCGCSGENPSDNSAPFSRDPSEVEEKSSADSYRPPEDEEKASLEEFARKAIPSSSGAFEFVVEIRNTYVENGEPWKTRVYDILTRMRYPGARDQSIHNVILSTQKRGDLWYWGYEKPKLIRREPAP